MPERGDITATIASTITLHDNMTAVLNRQANAANTLLNRFGALDTATDSFDPSVQWTMANGALSEMAEYMGRLVSLTQENNSQLSRMSDNIENMGQQMQRSADQAGSLTSVLKRAAAAFGGITAVKEVLDLSDTLTSTTARLDLMNDGLQTTAQLSQQIFQSAQRSRGSYQATADAVSKLGLMAGDAFDSSGEIVAFMEQINKQFTIAGTETAGIEAAMLQLTQAMGSGVLRGEEYNSVLEQAPNIIQSIADYMDVPKGQLKDMAADGAITAEIVKNAIFAAADETNARFESMPQTFSQIWTSFQNYAIDAFTPVLARMNQIANSQRFQNFVNGAIDALTTVADVALNVFEVVAEAGAFIADNWAVIEPIIYTAAGALIFYTTMLVAHNVVQGITSWLTAAVTTAVNIYRAAQDRAAGVTFASMVSQYGFNAALLACPITWVVLGIGALVGAMGIYADYANKTYGTTLSISGVIGGSLMVVLAAAGNLMIAVANIFIGLFDGVWNAVADFANFFGNVFDNPVGALSNSLGFGGHNGCICMRPVQD